MLEGNEEASDCCNAAKGPDYPFSVPWASSQGRDKTEKVSPAVEATNKAQQAEHDPKVLTHEEPSYDTQNYRGDDNCSCPSSRFHPTGTERDDTEEIARVESKECGKDILEPLTAKKGDQWPAEQVNDADNPSVFVEPVHVLFVRLLGSILDLIGILLKFLSYRKLPARCIIAS